MGQVIDLRVRRKARAAAVANHPSALARAAGGSTPLETVSGTGDADGRELDLLERAVKRLHPLVSEKLDRRRPLEKEVETELLAIMGELSVGLVRQATRRADRLTQRLKDADEQ